MTSTEDVFGEGPRPIDRERSLRLMLAILERNDPAFFDTMAAMLDDDEDRPALAGTLNVIFCLASDFATAASNQLGVDRACDVIREELEDSLRGDDG